MFNLSQSLYRRIAKGYRTLAIVTVMVMAIVPVAIVPVVIVAMMMWINCHHDLRLR
jgi:hypothetical protein